MTCNDEYFSPYNFIDIEFVEGPLQSLNRRWTFTELGNLGCKVEMNLFLS